MANVTFLNVYQFNQSPVETVQAIGFPTQGCVLGIVPANVAYIPKFSVYCYGKITVASTGNIYYVVENQAQLTTAFG